ncbi:MAG: T9SS type A sorting domain-containing protein [Chitinophagales bacterium]
MNKKILTYLFTLFLAVSSFPLVAQTLTGSPDVNVEAGDFLTEFEIVAHSTIHNNSNQAIEVKWARIENNIPDGWNSQVCDPISCWAPFVNGNPQPLTIPANGSMLLDLHFQPSEIEGKGVAIVQVWAVADSSNVNITMTYSADAYTVGIEDDPISQIKVYPNPVRDNLTIDLGYDTNVRYVEVYNLIGRKMAHYSVPSNGGKYRINASALPEGIYFVKMLNKNYEQIATRSFAKD